MVLIGDPKQAIYNFRGGDVTTYLQAARTAETKQTLSVNWRSDAALVAAFDRLLGGAALGDDRIVVRPVEAHHGDGRLVGAPHSAPFRVRVVRRQDVGKRSGQLTVKQVRPRVARDLAIDIRRLLASGATYDGVPIRPRDVAVIAYRHADLADAREALLDVGRPRRDRGRRQRLLDPGRRRVADARGGARAAASQCPGPVGGAHLLLRLLRRRDRPGRRGAHRRGRRDAAVLGRAVRRPRHGGRPRGRDRARPARAGARRGGGRPSPDRPAAHRRGAPRGDPDRAPGPCFPADLAARAGRRGPRGTGAGAHPAARLRRRRRPARHHPREQGAGVPRRLPPRPGRPLRAATRSARASTTPTSGVASTSAAAAPTGPSTAGAGPTRRPASGCGCSTSRSPAPSRRSSAGGRPPRTPSTRRCTGC